MIVTLLLIQGVIFIGLIFLLRQFMKGHLSGAMGHLQKLNDELVKQQTELREKTVTAQKEYELKMAKLQQEVSAEQTRVREEVGKTIEDTKQKALAEREKIINEAIETREKMRKEIMAEMEEKAIQHSKSVISEFFQGPLQEQIHAELMHQAIEGLKQLSVENFQIKTDDSAVIRVPRELKPEIQKQISDILQEKIKTSIEFKQEINPEMVAGIMIRFGPVTIDGSLVNRLGEAAARLKKESARRYQKIM